MGVIMFWLPWDTSWESLVSPSLSLIPRLVPPSYLLCREQLSWGALSFLQKGMLSVSSSNCVPRTGRTGRGTRCLWREEGQGPSLIAVHFAI